MSESVCYQHAKKLGKLRSLGKLAACPASKCTCELRNHIAKKQSRVLLTFLLTLLNNTTTKLELTGKSRLVS